MLALCQAYLISYGRVLHFNLDKERFPEAGEDVKVMGYRRDRELTLTVGLAFVVLLPFQAEYGWQTHFRATLMRSG